MGKRNKRARTLLKRMSILGEVPSLEIARRLGIEKDVQAELDKREAIAREEENKRKAEAQRLAEEKAKKLAAEKAKEEKAKAEAKKKKAAEAAKKKAAEAKKKKAVQKSDSSD